MTFEELQHTSLILALLVSTWLLSKLCGLRWGILMFVLQGCVVVAAETKYVGQSVEGAPSALSDLNGTIATSHVMRRLAVIHVQPGAATLQTALNGATSGDELVLADGTYTGSGSNVLDIDKSITIRALNAGRAVLDGQNVRRVVLIRTGPVNLQRLNITRGLVRVRAHSPACSYFNVQLIQAHLRQPC